MKLGIKTIEDKDELLKLINFYDGETKIKTIPFYFNKKMKQDSKIVEDIREAIEMLPDLFGLIYDFGKTGEKLEIEEEN